MNGKVRHVGMLGILKLYHNPKEIINIYIYVNIAYEKLWVYFMIYMNLLKTIAFLLIIETPS